MILTDYFRSTPDATWDFAIQSGINHGVIRLPEDAEFSHSSYSHWETVVKRFNDYGIVPVAIEPMPNSLHDHIKAGDGKRDESIAEVIKMFPIMKKFGINTICFNWMAHIGWLRTRSDYIERGGARVTEFKMSDFKPTDKKIMADELWANYEYFVKAVVPEAEKYEIKLGLHPDDPPVARLGEVERIMISLENIKRAVYGITPSESLGVTMCQANYHIMGEKVFEVIKDFKDKIFMVHFRNTTGMPEHFRETYHDNGELDMARLMKLYVELGIDVPIRVDHVPTMPGEVSTLPGYDALGRLYAMGYMRGLYEAVKIK
ncbi:MAG: mannonate dehydratase [Ruminococcaceae bacterium]|nr:mannonate dehydratase [Oscillospiraceae bacterium]